MNLESCTSGQRQIITTLDKPLMVSAGAGSGKTFTLTQRVIYALSEGGTTTDKAFLSGIDEVLAITFTKKAAAELKSRIKLNLLNQFMDEQALQVDNAWISTIHGMCSRMLREHALELGIDPSFELVSETEELRYREKAFDRVIERIKEGNDTALQSYLTQVRIYSTPQGGSSLDTYIQAVTNRALALPAGFDALVVPDIEGSPRLLLRSMVELGYEFIDVFNSLKKPLKTDAQHAETCEKALAQAEKLLDKGLPDTFDAPDFDHKLFIDTLFAFPKTSPKYRTKDSDPAFFSEYRARFADVAFAVEAACSAYEIRVIITIARLVYEQYQEIKGPGFLDNNDLLRLTYEALRDHDDLAQTYREQFGLVMVDEFQDTDELQVALLSLLSQPHFNNVCSVGDAQQSIYRFRGADVEVFYDFRERLKLEAPDACFVNLPDNFRSHGDVLAFVDTIFSQKEVFGSDFLSLTAKGPVATEDDPLFNQRPRISMALYDTRRGSSGMAQARVECAQRIAQHFSELRAGGASAGDMAILLGSMSNVDIYSNALREAGFECLVSGGSTFSETQEVGILKALLGFFANAFDDACLYAVLSSPLFAISDAALLHVTTRFDAQGKPHRRTLSEGLFAWEREQGLTELSDEDRDLFDFAYICLMGALDVLERHGLYEATFHVVRASGWLLRLQDQGAYGQSVAGNVFQALRMIQDIEALGFGITRSVNRFIDDCQTRKMPPGVLSTTSSNFVKIMTVHASKGLEFGHVALAEVRLTSKSDPIVAENIEGNTYCFVAPRAMSDKKVQTTLKELSLAEEPCTGGKADVVKAPTPAQRNRALKAYVNYQGLSEARRLFYVACTRASKSLFVGLCFSGKKDVSYEGKGVLEDLSSALRWDPSLTDEFQRIEYGGSEPLSLEYHILDQKVNTKLQTDDTIAGLKIPAALQPSEAPSLLLSRTHDEVCSYTSLQKHQDIPCGNESGMRPDAVPGDEAFSDEDATALGLAFHQIVQNVLDLGLVQEELAAYSWQQEVERQAAKRDLTRDQAARLDRALARWFSSSYARDFYQRPYVHAEVPFMIELQAPDGSFFLEGEIDAISYDQPPQASGASQPCPHGEPDITSDVKPLHTHTDSSAVWLVDFKTGGRAHETEQALTKKHLLQAQCYACALLRQGFSDVECLFVRVEHEDCVAVSEPQGIRYHFTQDDLSFLEMTISQSYFKGA